MEFLKVEICRDLSFLLKIGARTWLDLLELLLAYLVGFTSLPTLFSMSTLVIRIISVNHDDWS